MPTLAQLLAAYEKFEALDERNRDVRDLMSICNRVLEYDLRAAGHVSVRNAALAGAYDWRIVAKDTNYLQDALDATERLSNVIDEYLDNVTHSPCYGIFVVELAWELLDGKPVWSVLKKYDSTEIDYDKVNDRVYIIESKGLSISRKPLDENQGLFIIDKYAHYPILAAVALFEVLLSDNLKEWNRFAKKLTGLALATWRENAAKETQNFAKNVLATLSETNYAGTSDEVSFDFKEFVSGQGATTYKDIKKELESDIAIAFLGQANTAALPSGSSGLAAMKIMNLVRNDILWADMRRATKVINKLVQKDWDLLTNTASCPLKFEFDISDELDREKEVRIVDTALKANLPLPANEVYSKIGFTKPSSVEDVITPKNVSLF